MPKFAVIYGDTIGNIIMADSKEDAELLTKTLCIEIPNVPGGPGLGWKYNGAEFFLPEPAIDLVEDPSE